MMTSRSTSLLLVAVSVSLLASIPATGQHHEHGRVTFETSCSEEADIHFATGLALLHHMMYEQAEAAFNAAAEADPACAIAHWGIAMTRFQPLWPGQPSEEDLRVGSAAVERALALDASPRERAFIEPVQAFYAGSDDTAYRARLAAWADAQEALYHAYPDDVDAAAFYALAHLATAPPTDKSFSHQAAAGELLKGLMERAPEHPGLFHYTIHAFDNPALAESAVEVAREYDQLAPNVPHALHMPSHIFVRLGMWPETIEWNRRSAEAALQQSAGDVTSMHHIHALDYLMYAHLQQGQDQQAREVLDEIDAVERYQNVAAAAYGLAAAQARYPLEREAWAEAAALPARTPDTFDWDAYPWFEAMTHFARGLGAARSDDADGAREALDRLDVLYARTAEAGENYWGVHVDAQRKAVAAWIAHAEGRDEEALTLMREAADLEDSVDKSPVTPGAVLPARELLGDLLLELGRPWEALAAYRATLEISPNRLRSHYGAARAAEFTGDAASAAAHYEKLAEAGRRADTEREAFLEARRFISAR